MEESMEKSKLAAIIGAGIAASVSGAVIASSNAPQSQTLESAYNVSSPKSSQGIKLAEGGCGKGQDASCGSDKASDAAAEKNVDGNSSSGDQSGSDEASEAPAEKSTEGKCSSGGQCGAHN